MVPLVVLTRLSHAIAPIGDAALPSYLQCTTGSPAPQRRSFSVMVRIEARSVYGQARTRVAGNAVNEASQRVVCFTETPLEHLLLLTQQIDNRNFHFEPYGIALTKRIARARGANPIWYVDITPGHQWLTEPLNNLINEAIEANNFPQSAIAQIAPFIEQMGMPGYGLHLDFLNRTDCGRVVPAVLHKFLNHNSTQDFSRSEEHTSELQSPI